MEKEQIIQDSEILAKACQDAQNWIGVNEERVRSCGKSQSSVLVELRHQARLFKMRKRAS